MNALLFVLYIVASGFVGGLAGALASFSKKGKLPGSSPIATIPLPLVLLSATPAILLGYHLWPDLHWWLLALGALVPFSLMAKLMYSVGDTIEIEVDPSKVKIVPDEEADVILRNSVAVDRSTNRFRNVESSSAEKANIDDLYEYFVSRVVSRTGPIPFPKGIILDAIWLVLFVI